MHDADREAEVLGLVGALQPAVAGAEVLVADPLEAARAAGFDVLPATWMGSAPVLREAQEKDGRT